MFWHDEVHFVRAVWHDITMSISNNAIYSPRSTTDIPTPPVNILADRLLSRKRKRDGDTPPAKAPSRLIKAAPRANVPLHKAFTDSRLPLSSSLPQSFVVRVGPTFFLLTVQLKSPSEVLLNLGSLSIMTNRYPFASSALFLAPLCP